MRRTLIALLCALGLFTGCAAPAASQGPKQYQATFLTLFDTVTTILGYAESEEAFQAQAQEIYDQLLAAEDPMTLFDQLMTEYTDDVDSSGNVNGGTDGYTFGPGEMVDEFYEGTKALGEGEISQPVQSQYGYHIILRLSADNEAGYDKYAQIKMQAQIDQWMDEVQVERSETLESLDLQAFYDELNTLRSDISAASQADSAPAETTAPTETVAPSQSTAPAESEVPSETGTSAETPAA